MTLPNIPPNPFDVPSMIGRKIFEVAGQEILTSLMNGDGKRIGEAGMNMVKDIKLGDILTTAGKAFADVNAASQAASAQAKAATPEEVKIPFTKASEPATTGTSPSQASDEKPSDEVPVVVAVVPASTPVITPTEEQRLSADASIATLYELSTGHLTAVQQEALVSSVMNLVRLSSPEGFTGEHVRWLSGLYGNKSI